MIKQEAEVKELKNCTFQPRVNSRIAGDLSREAREVVRGMEMVERKKKMIEQKKQREIEREKEVFDFVSKYDKRIEQKKNGTVPVPFNLSKGKREKDEMLERFKNEETESFRPQTNFSERKDKIARIIEAYN